MPTTGGTHSGGSAPTEYWYSEIPSTTPVTQLDTDGDGIPDSSDIDDDDDGYNDNVDAFPLDSTEHLDTDGDGTGNNADTDDDGDGQTDANETLYGSDPLDSSSTYADLDGDGIADSSDPDRDGDGYDNSVDAFPDDPSQWQSAPSFAGSILEYTTIAASQTVILGARTWNGSSLNYTIDWGDGTAIQTVTSQGHQTHTYANAGVYDVKISGTFSRFFFSSANYSQKRRLTDIKQWGNLNYENFENAFQSCIGLTSVSATDTPNTPSSFNFVNMFNGCTNLTSVNNIGQFSLNGLINATDMFNGVTLTTSNYDSLLTGWASQGNIPSNISFNGGNSNFTLGSQAETAHNTLTNTYGWTITDGGGI